MRSLLMCSQKAYDKSLSGDNDPDLVITVNPLRLTTLFAVWILIKFYPKQAIVYGIPESVWL